MSKSKSVLTEIARRQKQAEEAAKRPQFSITDFCFDKQLDFVQDPAKFKTAVCSRRAGKCRKEGTLVKTPTGSVPIEQLKVGDTVYGYNTNGTVTPTNVIGVWDQGVKDVVDLSYNRQVIASSTVDHKWLAHNVYKHTRTVKQLKNFNCRDRIAEEYERIPGGSRQVDEAYAIGALLGDGCSTCSGVQISCNDEQIVKKSTESLGLTKYTKSNGNNYTWSIHTGSGVKYNNQYYNEWLRGRLAHQKICDLAEIRTWNRASQIEFLSGLIDTDGSVNTTKDGRLVISIGMQAKSVIDAVESLLLDLFQVQARRRLDNRTKYKNGPVHVLKVSINKYSKRILRELTTVVPRKQWKPEYENLVERNSHPKYVGFTLSKPYKAQCWDITVSNDTNLFLDANGLIGHNTIACAADMYHTAKSFPDVNVVYITLNRRSAKRIIWRELTALVSQYEKNADGSPSCQVNNTELSITLSNKSTMFLAGADDEGEIDKFRGLAIKKVYIDEAQSFRSYIKELVNDVLVPALYDYDGSLILIGTPGPVPNGYFYDASNNPSWAHHHWTVYDNPWISRKSGKPVSEIIATANARRGINESHPTHLRENLGIWVKDPNSLVFAFDPALNTFDSLTQTQLDDMQFIFGIDIGWKDADAIAVIGYNFTEKVVYLVEELITSKQTISDLVNQIKALQSKYKPIKMVMDAGALGKKIQEEILQRYGLFIEAAEKQRKLEFIELMNDDLRTRRLKVFSGSRFAEDAWRVEWDRDGSKQKVSDRFHTDIGDALLYGWRESRHYQAEPLIPDPVKDSEDYMRMLEERDAEALMQAKNRTNIDDIAPDQSLMDSLFDDDLTGFDD